MGEGEKVLNTQRVRLQEQAFSTSAKPQAPVSQMTTLSINMDEEAQAAAEATPGHCNSTNTLPSVLESVFS